VEAVVRRELLGGRPLADTFERFDAAPLGAASIAQVHSAI
jgi:predicted unusual protein kinase regulating ubiquinone biosynthesis (AarF/ABC1/UbiB family)